MTTTPQEAGVGPGTALQDREWTRWSDQRPPNEPGCYRYRASFDLLGLPVTAEWAEDMYLCGMGYGDSEWWPLRPCYWNGYRRYITIDNLEWSAVQAYDQEDVVWQGLNLLPCPFTGKPATVETSGQYIGAPLWRTEALWLSSPGVPKRRWTDAKAMVAAWNTRAPDPACNSFPKLVEALEELTAACEADFISDDTEPSEDEDAIWFPDEDAVASGEGGDCAITFGHIRRARAALSLTKGDV